MVLEDKYMNTSLIDIQEMTKVFNMGEIEVHALDGVSFHIEKGEMVVRSDIFLVNGK